MGVSFMKLRGHFPVMLRILGLCSRWHRLDHDPDTVVRTMTQSGYSVGGDGRAKRPTLVMSRRSS